LIAVAHAEVVDFPMEGVRTANGQEFVGLTLRNRNLKKEQFILGPTWVPSGVARIAHLQAGEQYAYIKP
jgi:intracellular sulfur oxidation DsrE/DsrF family protein